MIYDSLWSMCVVYVPPSPVDELLMMGVNVTVYSGQLDLIVDTIGKSSQGQLLCSQTQTPMLATVRAASDGRL